MRSILNRWTWSHIPKQVNAPCEFGYCPSRGPAEYVHEYDDGETSNSEHLCTHCAATLMFEDISLLRYQRDILLEALEDLMRAIGGDPENEFAAALRVYEEITGKDYYQGLLSRLRR